MPFNHQAYIAQFLANPGYNDAVLYGVTIKPAVVVPGQPYWRVIGIHHLTGAENHGQHHVFCDVLDEAGKRIEQARINILTNGKPRGFMVTDKPANEPGTNTQMHWEDTLELYLAGDIPGEHGAGFHTRHEDEEPGTTRGHHSFYIVWQRVKAGDTPPPDPIPTPGTDYIIGGPSDPFYGINTDKGEFVGTASSLIWARRIVAGLTLLEATEKAHPVESYIEGLKKQYGLTDSEGEES